LENLEVAGADIDQMVYTSDVNISTLKLDHPVFSHYTERTAITDTPAPQGLYPLIENILTSISIDDLTIINGQYLQRGISDPQKYQIEADGINFNMDRVYIGPDTEKTKEQFFYAQDAAVDITRVKVAL